MAKIRLGIIGLGFGQQVHLPAFSSDPRCEIVAVCSQRQALAEKVAAQYGASKRIKAYQSWKDLLEDPEVDAVTLALPPDVQAEILPLIPRFKKHVFCEKPLGLKSSMQDEILAAFEENKRIHQIDFEFFENDLWLKTKQKLQNQDFGLFKHAILNWNLESYAIANGKTDSWKMQFQRGGGVLNTFVSHVYFNLEWFFGPIRRLCAHLDHSPNTSRKNFFRGVGFESDTLVHLQLEFENGGAASVVASNCSVGIPCHRLEIYCEEGSLALENLTSDYFSGFVLKSQKRGQAELSIERSADFSSSTLCPDGRILMVGKMAKRFFDGIEKGQNPIPSLKEGFRVQRLIEAAVSSHQRAGWVEVDK